MHRYVARVFIISCVLLACLSLGWALELQKSYRIELPASIHPEQATIVVGKYGKGMTVSQIVTKPKLYRYDIDISGVNSAIGRVDALKLLIYVPGYKMVKAQLDALMVSPDRPYTPGFVPAPTVPLTIRLTNSTGKPLPGRRLQINLDFRAHEYFGYVGGLDYAAHIASGITDKNGQVTVNVPNLLDDPYFMGGNTPGFGLEMIEGTGSDRWPHVLLPAGIPAQATYGQTIVRAVTGQARIRGVVSDSFLRKNGVNPSVLRSAKPMVYFEATAGNGSIGTSVGKDGSFSMYLDPGTYDLRLEVRTKPVKTITVGRGVTLSEEEDHLANLK